jgi:hypothetical protein
MDPFWGFSRKGMCRGNDLERIATLHAGAGEVNFIRVGRQFLLR